MVDCIDWHLFYRLRKDEKQRNLNTVRKEPEEKENAAKHLFPRTNNDSVSSPV